MASTAWTANRADLVKALAESRAREAAARAEAAEAENRARKAETEAQRRERQRQQRRRRYEQRKRESLRQIKATQDHMRAEVEIALAVASTAPDPNAAQHRADLIAALKETP